MGLSRISFVALVTLMTGCGEGSMLPFDTVPRSPPAGAHEDFSRIGVCYNRETSTPRQVLAVARRNCEPGTTPRLIEQDARGSCPLLTPMRATFACLKPGTVWPVR
jgi:hypothetical protein